MILHLALFLILQLPSWNVTATLLDRETGTPVIGATVALEGTTLKTKSDSTGWFKLGPISADSCSLRIVHDDYVTAQRVVVFSSKMKPLSFSLMSKRVLISRPVEKP